jgi:hypothetical protein
VAAGQRPRAGGILGLQLEILSDPDRRLALQADLLRIGRSLDDLGSEALTWYDLRALVRQLQGSTDSELAAAILGYHPWSVEAQLLAIIADTEAMGNWQRAGKKNAPKPKPIERPWLKSKGQTLGKNPIPVASFDAWWDAKSAKA